MGHNVYKVRETRADLNAFDWHVNQVHTVLKQSQKDEGENQQEGHWVRLDYLKANWQDVYQAGVSKGKK